MNAIALLCHQIEGRSNGVRSICLPTAVRGPRASETFRCSNNRTPMFQFHCEELLVLGKEGGRAWAFILAVECCVCPSGAWPSWAGCRSPLPRALPSLCWPPASPFPRTPVLTIRKNQANKSPIYLRKWFSHILVFSSCDQWQSHDASDVSSQFLCLVPARIMLRKMWPILPLSLLLIRYGHCLPAEIGNVDPCKISSHHCSLKSEATDLEYEKDTKTLTEKKKKNMHTQKALCKHSFSLLLFQH